MTTYARFLHNGQIQTVALFEGLYVEELTSLLKTIFGISNNIVGILAEVHFKKYYNIYAPTHG